MIRRSPSEAYVKFLLVHPKKYKYADIQEILLFAGLDWLGNWYLKRLAKELNKTKPSPFVPGDTLHVKSQAFVLKQGLYPFFFPDEKTEIAFRILETPRAKELVETLSLSKAPPGVIAASLKAQQNFLCGEEDVQRFQQLFWNIDLLSGSELRELLAFRSSSVSLVDDPEIQAQQEAIESVKALDPVKAASELPFSPLSAIVSQTKLGIMPSDEEFERLLKAARALATVKVFESAMSPEANSHLKCRSYATSVRELSMVLESQASPMQDLKAQLTQFMLQMETVQPPLISQLGETNETSIEVPYDDADDPDEN